MNVNTYRRCIFIQCNHLHTKNSVITLNNDNNHRIKYFYRYLVRNNSDSSLIIEDYNENNELINKNHYIKSFDNINNKINTDKLLKDIEYKCYSNNSKWILELLKLSESGYYNEILSCFKIMESYNLKIELAHRNCYLNACKHVNRPDIACNYLFSLPDNHFILISAIIVIESCIPNGEYQLARKVIDKLLKLQVQVTPQAWYYLLDAYIKVNNINGMLETISEMEKYIGKLSIIKYNKLLKACYTRNDLIALTSLFNSLNNSGLEPDNYSYYYYCQTALKNNNLSLACNVLDRYIQSLQTKSISNKFESNGLVYLLNAILFYCQKTNNNLIDELFNKYSQQITTNYQTFIILFKSCNQMNYYNKIKQYFNIYINNNITFDKSNYLLFWNELIFLFKNSNKFSDIIEFIHELKDNNRPVYVYMYNDLISIYCNLKYFDEAIDCFDIMINESINPTIESYEILTKGYVDSNYYQLAYNYLEIQRSNSIAVSNMQWNDIINNHLNNSLDWSTLSIYLNEMQVVDKILPGSNLISNIIKYVTNKYNNKSYDMSVDNGIFVNNNILNISETNENQIKLSNALISYYRLSINLSNNGNDLTMNITNNPNKSNCKLDVGTGVISHILMNCHNSIFKLLLHDIVSNNIKNRKYEFVHSLLMSLCTKSSNQLLITSNSYLINQQTIDADIINDNITPSNDSNIILTNSSENANHKTINELMISDSIRSNDKIAVINEEWLMLLGAVCESNNLPTYENIFTDILVSNCHPVVGNLNISISISNGRVVNNKLDNFVSNYIILLLNSYIHNKVSKQTITTTMLYIIQHLLAPTVYTYPLRTTNYPTVNLTDLLAVNDINRDIIIYMKMTGFYVRPNRELMEIFSNVILHTNNYQLSDYLIDISLAYDLIPNTNSLKNIISSYINNNRIDVVEQWLNDYFRLIYIDIVSSNYLYSKTDLLTIYLPILNLYMNNFQLCNKLINNIRNNIYTNIGYNVILQHYVDYLCSKQLISTAIDMIQKHMTYLFKLELYIPPHKITFIDFISNIFNLKKLAEISNNNEKLVNQSIEHYNLLVSNNDISDTIKLYEIVLHYCSLYNNLDDASWLIDLMRSDYGLLPNESCFNSYIKLLCYNNRIDEARDALRIMYAEALQTFDIPNDKWIPILTKYSELGRPLECFETLEIMSNKPSSHPTNDQIDLYIYALIKDGQMHEVHDKIIKLKSLYNNYVPKENLLMKCLQYHSTRNNNKKVIEILQLMKSFDYPINHNVINIIHSMRNVDGLLSTLQDLKLIK